MLVDLDEVDNVITVAKRFPLVRIVVNHFGFSKVAGGAPEFDAWKAAVSRLAQPQNLFIKISGGQSTSWDAVSAMKPYVVHTVLSFGYDRCIYNGNWFVVNSQDGFYSY